MRILVEVRRFNNENKLFINDQLFDWELDENSLEKINKINDKEELLKIHENIRSYFLNSLQNYISKPLTIKEVYEAIKVGYIEL